MISIPLGTLPGKVLERSVRGGKGNLMVRVRLSSNHVATHLLVLGKDARPLAEPNARHQPTYAAANSDSHTDKGR